METQRQDDAIIAQLKLMNEGLQVQRSIPRTFLTGVVYGVGFFLGSAIIATIALGIFGPWIAEIDWVQKNFERGATLIK